MDPNSFLALQNRVALLGTVNTGTGGFLQNVGNQLVEAGKLKKWDTPPAPAQVGMLMGRVNQCRIDFSSFDTTVATYHDLPQQWWQEQGSRMIEAIVQVIPASGGDYESGAVFHPAEETGGMANLTDVRFVLDHAAWGQGEHRRTRPAAGGD